MKLPSSSSNYILQLGTYPPRECGIATFTRDLSQAFDKKFNPVVKTKVLALNENPTSSHNYGRKVVDYFPATELNEYVSLAHDINEQDSIKVVNIQHEYGLFGGEFGDYIIPFLQVLDKPVVTTFHTVLPNPEEYMQKVATFIATKSDRIVVMNELSKKILKKDYGIPDKKISYIPHGIPQVPYESTEEYKAKFGLEGKTVLSTYGLISRDKGIEYALEALPDVVKKYPDVVYLIVGQTHPVVRKEQGEEYRNYLESEVERLGLQDHVRFYNQYSSLEEITYFLRATDLFISPVLGVQQSVSGTLSSALGCGRPVISTATQYAKSVVSKDIGRLVQFKNSEDLRHAMLELLEDRKQLENMGAQAYAVTRHMIWPNVAAEYQKVYKEVADDLGTEERKLPEIKLDHLRRMTDSIGLIQHAKYSRPDMKFGYSQDDNARALIVCAKRYKQAPSVELRNLMKVYLSFIKFTQRKTGYFANIVDKDKKKDRTNDEDVYGRSIWALGFLAAQDYLPEDIQKEANSLLHKSLAPVTKINSPRAIAFTMSGLYYFLKKNPQKTLLAKFKRLADKQVALYEGFATNSWNWFEDTLTYSNSKLPESLYYAYDLTKKKSYLEVAQKTLKFLTKITFEKEHYSPIGQAGWYYKDEQRSYFDQQPEDTASMIETKLIAYEITKRKQHLEDAYKAFQWFLGKNHLRQMVYDEVTGGCHDGVGRNTLNLNQGAESTISYLSSRISLENYFSSKSQEI